MVGVFCRLKLSLIAGGLRGSTTGGLGFAASILIGLLVAVTGFWTFMRMGAFEDVGVFGAHVLVVACTLLVVGWGLVPILAFRSDETLDPARFALLPLRALPTAVGLLAAAWIGIVPVTFTVALSGAVVGFARGPLSVAFGVAAMVLTMVMCLLLGRALPLALAPILRGRRGTDVMVGGLVAGTSVILLVEWAAVYSDPSDVDAVMAGVASVVRWTPPGMAGQAVVDASGGDYAAATARLAGALAAVALLGWWWTAMLGNALADLRVSEAGTVVRRGRDDVFGPARLEPRLAAVIGRELLYQRREPRRKAGVMTLVLLCGVILTMLAPLGSGEPGSATAIMVTTGALAALTLVGNQFGLQGSAVWSVMAWASSPRDLRTELLGASVAATVVTAPVMLLFAALHTLAIAVDPWDPAAWASSLGAVFGGLLLALGVSPLVSVLFPYPLPNRGHNPFAGPGAGQGLVVSLTITAAMLSINAFAIPLYLLAPDLDGWTSLPFVAGSLAYGLAVAWGGIALAARVGAPRLPEILARVSRPVV